MKVNLSVGRPDATRAVMQAEGPGRTVNSSEFSMQSCTRWVPGSDMAGIPASVTSARVLPSCRALMADAPLGRKLWA